MNRWRRRAAGLSLAGAAALATALAVGAGSGAAATQVPKITNLTVTPARFCVQQSSSCSSTGTTVRFNISSKAFVRGNMWPRFRNEAGFRVLRRQFHVGTNSFQLSDTRLTPGKWTLKLQGRNNVGSGTTANIDVRVVK